MPCHLRQETSGHADSQALRLWWTLAVSGGKGAQFGVGFAPTGSAQIFSQPVPKFHAKPSQPPRSGGQPEGVRPNRSWDAPLKGPPSQHDEAGAMLTRSLFAVKKVDAVSPDPIHVEI
jgi:hypothetical protein